MRTIVNAVPVLLIIAVTVFAGLANQAASAAPSWEAQTCAAFTAYQAHPAAGRLAAVVTDSTHLGRSYLKADAGQLYADASSPSPKAARYAAKDETYVASDCT